MGAEGYLPRELYEGCVASLSLRSKTHAPPGCPVGLDLIRKATVGLKGGFFEEQNKVFLFVF